MIIHSVSFSDVGVLHRHVHEEELGSKVVF